MGAWRNQFAIKSSDQLPWAPQCAVAVGPSHEFLSIGCPPALFIHPRSHRAFANICGGWFPPGCDTLPPSYLNGIYSYAISRWPTHTNALENTATVKIQTQMLWH